jgi:hypothetical protein
MKSEHRYMHKLAISSFVNTLKGLLVTAVVLFVSWDGARADQGELKDLMELSFADLLQVKVVTPSKLPEHPRDSPNIISIYSSKDIALFGGRDLGEVLSRIT